MFGRTLGLWRGREGNATAPSPLPPDVPVATSECSASSEYRSFAVGSRVVYTGARGPEPAVVLAVEAGEEDTYVLSVSASADAESRTAESRTVTTVARRLRLGSAEGASVDASEASASAAAAAARAALEESDAALAAALQADEDEAAAAAAAAAASSPLAVLLNLMSVQAGAQPQLQVPAVRLVINGGGPVPLAQMSPIALLAAALGGAGPGFAFGAGGLGGADLTYEQLLALQARMGGAVPRGASESQLSAIPVHGYVRRGAEAETCSVCLSELEEGQPVRTMPCGHCYHSGSCIDPWLRTSQACPCCRAELPS